MREMPFREEVYAGGRTDAALLDNLLQVEGIDTLVTADKRFSRIGPHVGSSVYVLDPAHVERARDIAERYRRNEPLKDPRSYRSWRCRACNELIEGQFEVCWKCSRSRASGPLAGHERSALTSMDRRVSGCETGSRCAGDARLAARGAVPDPGIAAPESRGGSAADPAHHRPDIANPLQPRPLQVGRSVVHFPFSQRDCAATGEKRIARAAGHGQPILRRTNAGALVGSRLFTRLFYRGRSCSQSSSRAASSSGSRRAGSPPSTAPRASRAPS